MHWGVISLTCFDQCVDGLIAEPLCWIIDQCFQESLADQFDRLFFFLSDFLGIPLF